MLILEKEMDEITLCVFTNYRLILVSFVSVPFEPMCRLYIPVVEEHLKAGGKLEPRERMKTSVYSNFSLDSSYDKHTDT